MIRISGNINSHKCIIQHHLRGSPWCFINWCRQQAAAYTYIFSNFNCSRKSLCYDMHDNSICWTRKPERSKFEFQILRHSRMKILKYTSFPLFWILAIGILKIRRYFGMSISQDKSALWTAGKIVKIPRSPINYRTWITRWYAGP